jgi:hypothetical protein
MSVADVHVLVPYLMVINDNLDYHRGRRSTMVGVVVGRAGGTAV